MSKYVTFRRVLGKRTIRVKRVPEIEAKKPLLDFSDLRWEIVIALVAVTTLAWLAISQGIVNMPSFRGSTLNVVAIAPD
jgi:hypothetical protein